MDPPGWQPVLHQGVVTPFTTAVPAEKKVQAKKEESEQSDDDMGFGLFD